MTSIQRRKRIRSKAKGQGGVRPANRKRIEWEYLIVWEFRVRSGMVKRFERMYGSDGGWARLFEQDESYIGTELIHDLKAGRSYVTLDFWVSQKAYDAFRKQNLARYKALDQKCEEMTEGEREIGRFVRIPRK
jgi:hypothetical protein